MHWNQEESLSRAEMTKLQGERLAKACTRVYERVAFYKKAFDDKGVKPSDIKLLAEVHTILNFTLLALVVLHVGAALRHHFIERQPFLQRMGWGKKERT